MPIKTFPSFEVDPLASITATLAKLDKEDEEMWIQIMARPIADDWHKRGTKMVNRIRGGRGLRVLIKGSRSSAMDKVVAALRADEREGTGHAA